jgi:hypothetical protein
MTPSNTCDLNHCLDTLPSAPAARKAEFHVQLRLSRCVQVSSDCHQERRKSKCAEEKSPGRGSIQPKNGLVPRRRAARSKEISTELANVPFAATRGASPKFGLRTQPS